MDGAAGGDVEDLPVDLYVEALEYFARVLGDGLEAVGGEREDGGAGS